MKDIQGRAEIQGGCSWRELGSTRAEVPVAERHSGKVGFFCIPESELASGKKGQSTSLEVPGRRVEASFSQERERKECELEWACKSMCVFQFSVRKFPITLR